jgi:hypothetical protein
MPDFSTFKWLGFSGQGQGGLLSQDPESRYWNLALMY